MMPRCRPHRQRGSVVIVALCFVAVLGIALASYLAVSSQAMKLSGRSYQAALSEQLAESGLEGALWAFNHNNWTGWDVTTSVPNATHTLTFPATKYGASGVLATINIRVNHRKVSFWNASTNYTTSDMVWFRGLWYQCILANLAHPTRSNPNYWVSAPGRWNSLTPYAAGDIVLYGSTVYRCTNPHTNQTPPTGPGYWSGVAATTWSAATSYAANDVAFGNGTAYRCIAPNTNQAPPNPAYWAGAPVIYAEGVATSSDSAANARKTQLRAEIAPAAIFPNAAAADATLTLSAAGTVDSYDSDPDANPTSPALTYAAATPHTYAATLAGGSTTGTAVTVTNATVNGYVAAPAGANAPHAPLFAYSGSTVLKGTAAGSGIDLTRVSRSPYIPQFDPAAWDAATGYRIDDVVRYSDGYLYVCKVSNTNQAPGSSPFYWRAPTSFAATTITLGTVGGPTANYVFAGDLFLDTGSTITIQGPVILDVQGELHIRNDGQIKILGTGAAEIQVSSRFSVGGGFPATYGIVNQTNDPKKLLVVGTVGATALPNRYWANTPFYGVITMPNITSTLNIYADTPNEFHGAVAARSIGFPSGANLHYDTSLRTTPFHSLDAPYVVTEWRELTDPTEKMTLP